MKDTINAFVPHSPPLIKGSGEGPLSGKTFAIKDLYDVAGHKTSGGNPEWLETHAPATQTSPLVENLLAAGADAVGKTICDELFYAFTGANARYGTPVNTKAPDRMPGGSSSGSAAAVAGGLCDFSLGSDTGGSSRVPASFCGIYGIRPTHGRLDGSHAMAMAPSFDAPGWFASDPALFRDVGAFLLDGNKQAADIDTVIIGDFAFSHADSDVADPLRAFLDNVGKQFPAVDHLDHAPGHMDLAHCLETFRIIQAFETWQTFGDWIEEHNPALGPGIKERFAIAKTITREEYDKALSDRAEISAVLNRLLVPGKVLCLPTAASLPPLLDASNEDLNAFRVKTMTLICLAVLGGLPQISIPAATSNGCPVGLGFTGWRGGDEALLDLAASLGAHILSES